MASPVHMLCDDYAARLLELDPIMASNAGLFVHDDLLTDLSPDGYAERADLARDALSGLDRLVPQDDTELVAAEVLRERIEAHLALHDTGVLSTALTAIAGPLQDLRMVFTLAAPTRAEGWATVARRLRAVPTALLGLRQSLSTGADRGQVASRQDVIAVARQCDVWSGEATGESAFDSLVAGASAVPGVDMIELDAAASVAAAAFGEFAQFLVQRLVRVARQDSAAGPDVYPLWLRHFVGDDVDPSEAYAWAWDEFHRVAAEMRRVAGSPVSLSETARRLDADPRYQVASAADFEIWLRQNAAAALSALRDEHFAIPDHHMRLECRISADDIPISAYYVAPSADFDRPGRVVWRRPEPGRPVPLWRELSRLHHEVAPGHHLQESAVLDASHRLNQFQRLVCDISGHTEGWALYAERLMGEVGFLDDPGYRFGMLDGQLLRTARLVLDIGLHLKLPIPIGAGDLTGATWTPALAHDFLCAQTTTTATQATREVTRHLSWPGQAVSYKLGERGWLAAREHSRRSQGTRFTLTAFHQRALELGPTGPTALARHLAAG